MEPHKIKLSINLIQLHILLLLALPNLDQHFAETCKKQNNNKQKTPSVIST